MPVTSTIFSPALSPRKRPENECLALQPDNPIYKLSSPTILSPNHTFYNTGNDGDEGSKISQYTRHAKFVMRTTVDGVELTPQEHIICWSEDADYEHLELLDEKAKSPFKTEHTSFFMSSGIVRLLRKSNPLSAEQQSPLGVDLEPIVLGIRNATTQAELIASSSSMIMRALSDNPAQSLLLEVDRRYGTICIDPESDSLVDLVLNAIYERTNARQKRYRAGAQDERSKECAKTTGEFLSRAERDAIFTDAVIANLINKDPALDKNQPWTREGINFPSSQLPPKQAFINRVKAFAPNLLAMCVYAKEPMTCLFELMYNAENPLDDEKLPIQWESWPTCATTNRCKPVCDAQRYFSVFTFDEAALEEGDMAFTVDSSTTVPIAYHRRLGGGGFGDVYEVSIESGYHKFNVDPHTTYALKIFTATEYSQANFQKEMKLIEKLVCMQNDNITVPLAAWTHGTSFFMLFQKAECDLDDYILHHDPPAKDSDGFMTLIRQLINLAHALQTIHSRKPSGLAGLDAHSITGFHHDLTPRNILILPGGLWTITDFGTAQLNKHLSGQASHQATRIWDGPYAPPEVFPTPASKQPSLSRPFDIWSLGCIYLEICVWVLCEPTETVKGFREERQRDTHKEGLTTNAPVADSTNWPGFWRLKTSGEKDLKQSVRQKITELKGITQSSRLWSDLLVLIEEMLNPKPRARPLAETVHHSLVAMRDNAQYERNYNLRRKNKPDAVPGPYADAVSQYKPVTAEMGDAVVGTGHPAIIDDDDLATSSSPLPIPQPNLPLSPKPTTKRSASPISDGEQPLPKRQLFQGGDEPESAVGSSARLTAQDLAEIGQSLQPRPRIQVTDTDNTTTHDRRSDS